MSLESMLKAQVKLMYQFHSSQHEHAKHINKSTNTTRKTISV